MDRRDPWGNALLDRMRWKSGAYWHVVTRAGRQHWSRLGTDYRAALREWTRLEGLQADVRTVAQAIEAYLLERDLAPKTRQGYENSAGRLVPWIGACYLDEVSRRDVRAWLHARSAPVSANRDLALLRAVYSHAVECGWCEANPASGVSRRRESPRRRVATPAELAALSAVATPIWRALLAVAVLTGMRPGELRTLSRAALTQDGIELRRSKTGAESLILWTPALSAAIEPALAAQDPPTLWVFPSRKRRPYSEHGITTVWQRLCERAGIEGLQLRDLRRTAATEAESLEAASALLGHGSVAITRRVYRVRDRVSPTR